MSDNCSASYRICRSAAFLSVNPKISGTIRAADRLNSVAGKSDHSSLQTSRRPLRFSAEADRVTASFPVPAPHETLPLPRIQQGLATSSTRVGACPGAYFEPECLPNSCVSAGVPARPRDGLTQTEVQLRRWGTAAAPDATWSCRWAHCPVPSKGTASNVACLYFTLSGSGIKGKAGALLDFSLVHQ